MHLTLYRPTLPNTPPRPDRSCSCGAQAWILPEGHIQAGAKGVSCGLLAAGIIAGHDWLDQLNEHIAQLVLPKAVHSLHTHLLLLAAGHDKLTV